MKESLPQVRSRGSRWLRQLCALVIAVIPLGPPAPGNAQEPAKVSRIGILDNEASLQAPRLEAFRQELRTLGWIEGRNLSVEARIGPADQFGAFAAELVRLDLELIFAPKSAAVEAVRGARKNFPIVFAVAPDPVAAGFVASLRRPGGNITGTTSMLADLGAKQLELLRTAAPQIRRVAVFAYPHYTFSSQMVHELETAAKPLGIQLHRVDWDHPDRLVSAFEAAKKARAEALLVLPNILSIRHGGRLADLALKYRLPSIAVGGTIPERGGLMSYGPEQVDLYRRAATYVDKILRGAKPADLPVEQPRILELVINTKTAKGLGLTIPPSLLQRADRVID